ncbi:MAG: PEGA domain-containing protein, partial [Myxococcales bacterium]|nr:PEGA domain-containing protein [Myxococcales bacterium]
AAAPPAAGACQVAFASSPDGAEVTVDGKPLGVTPLTVEVPCAAARVAFHRDRYQDHAQALALRPGAQTITARLERPTFTVTVTSRPPGAAVTMGGRVVGKTPVQLTVPGFEGTPVDLALTGFRAHRERVYATKGGQRIEVRLKRR